MGPFGQSWLWGVVGAHRRPQCIEGIIGNKEEDTMYKCVPRMSGKGEMSNSCGRIGGRVNDLELRKVSLKVALGCEKLNLLKCSLPRIGREGELKMWDGERN